MGSGEAAVVIERLLVWDAKWIMSRHKQYCGSCFVSAFPVVSAQRDVDFFWRKSNVLSMSQPRSCRPKRCHITF